MEKKGDIWIISHFAGSPRHGMVFRPYYLAKEFSAKGEEVKVFASDHSHVRNINPNIKGFYQSEIVDGVEYIWFKNIRYNPANLILRMLSLIVFCFSLLFFSYWKINAPKAIVVSSPSLLPIVNGWLLAKLFKAKLIFEVRDIWPESLIQLGNMSPRHPVVQFFSFFEKFAYKHCDYCVALMPTALAHFQAKGLSESKYRHIPNGVVFDKEDSEDLNIGLPKDKFIVGFAGAIGKANNLDLLLDMAKLSQDEELFFAIVGKGEEKERLLQRIDSEGIKNIQFFDPVPKDKVISVLRQFDLCFISLVYTPLFDYGVSPNKLFDYMAAKRPILYCVKSGNTPVADAACGIEVRDASVAKAFEAIVKLKNLEVKEREQLGLNGYEYVKQNHDYDKLSQQFLELINE